MASEVTLAAKAVSAFALVVASAVILAFNVVSSANLVAASVFKLAEIALSLANLVAASAAMADALVPAALSTYVLVAFTLGYLSSEAASVITLMLLLDKFSFNKSALVLSVISVDNPLVTVETELFNAKSAAARVLASEVTLAAKAVSAFALVVASAVILVFNVASSANLVAASAFKLAEIVLSLANLVAASAAMADALVPAALST